MNVGIVGIVESCTTGCAIQFRGSATIASRTSSSSAAVACVPTTSPLPPEPATGLTTISSTWLSTYRSAVGSMHRYVSTLGRIGSSSR